VVQWLVRLRRHRHAREPEARDRVRRAERRGDRPVRRRDHELHGEARRHDDLSRDRLLPLGDPTPVKAAGLALAAAATLVAPSARAACAGRTTDPAGVQGYAYGADEARSYATARARVHWTTGGPHAPKLASSRPDGVPDSVALAADAAEQALAAYADWGYR